MYEKGARGGEAVVTSLSLSALSHPAVRAGRAADRAGHGVVLAADQEARAARAAAQADGSGSRDGVPRVDWHCCRRPLRRQRKRSRFPDRSCSKRARPQPSCCAAPVDRRARSARREFQRTAVLLLQSLQKGSGPAAIRKAAFETQQQVAVSCSATLSRSPRRKPSSQQVTTAAPHSSPECTPNPIVPSAAPFPLSSLGMPSGSIGPSRRILRIRSQARKPVCSCGGICVFGKTPTGLERARAFTSSPSSD
jgi:hypothetical protein